MRQDAIVLIGPTGAGKTPLGESLQAHGLWGRRCHHFDFGACLRKVISGRPPGFDSQELSYLSDVVGKGALLEDETFYIALKILDRFRDDHGVSSADLLIMNGLPRHLGQATALDPQLNFTALVSMECNAVDVCERLRRNSGGDRVQRTDDALPLVMRKLQVFTERTEPLLAYFEQRGVPVIRVPVTVEMQAREILEILEADGGPGRRLNGAESDRI